jgi:hemolysin-activating ACP:hemolysin acyltransferase
MMTERMFQTGRWDGDGVRQSDADIESAMHQEQGKGEPVNGGASRSSSAQAVDATSDNVALSAWKPKDPAVALGLAVEFLRRKPAFARLQFGEWSQVLSSQINRGHYFFVVDQRGRIHGFLGWALTQEQLAEQWIEGRSGLRNEECRGGECVIVNAWAAETDRATRFILDTCREFFAGKRTIYFKRHYADGRTRPVRLAVNDFVSRHLARGAATRLRPRCE